MTSDESKRIIRLLGAAWSYFPAGPDVTALWTERLEPLDFEPTRTAAKRLVETSDQLPSLASFLRSAREEARFYRLANAAPSLAPGEATYACSCGEGQGWVVVDEGNPPTLRPCRHCRPETYEQWAGGHYAPNHRADCAVCQRRGRGAA